MKKLFVIAVVALFGGILANVHAQSGAGDVPPLTETFTALDLSVQYPAGWTAQQAELGIEIFNHQTY